MGYLKSFAATEAATSTKVSLDRDCHTLLVRRCSSNAINGQLRSNCPEVVSASIRTRGGDLDDTIKRAILGDLAAYSQYGYGAVQEFYTDAASYGMASNATGLYNDEGSIAGVAVNKFTSLLPISLTADGKCVSVSTGDDFSFLFENLLPGYLYDFFALEGDVTGTNILHYENFDVLADQHERDIDVDSMAGIVIPALTSFRRLLLTYGNGRVSKYSIAELKFLSGQHNLVESQLTSYEQGKRVTVVEGPMTSELLVMPLRDLTRLELDTDGTPMRFLTVFNRSRLVA